MTNEALETQDESRISRRNALKAAVGVGVGAIAWSGPQITSFGATPAYAQGCTGFTVNEFAEDRNTNQGGCPGADFRYQDDSGIPLPAGYTWNWNPLQCPGDTITFDYPDGISCSVDIYLYASTGGAGRYQDYWALWTFDLPDSGGSFVLPDGVAGNVLDPPPPDDLPTNYANTRFAVRVQCISTGLSHCL